MAGLIVASAFFSSSETALFSLSHDELRQFRIGRRRERLVTQLLLQPDRLLTAILFWNLVVNLSYFSVSVVLTQRLVQSDHHAFASVFAVGSLMGIIVFGEVVAKSAAVAYRLELASWLSWPLSIAVRLFDPVYPLFQRLTLVLRRGFWPHVTMEPYLHIDDLEQAVENSQLSPDVIEQERNILHNILALSEITVEEVMRPRGTYVTLPAPVSPRDLSAVDPSTEYVAVCSADSEEVHRVLVLSGVKSLPESHIETMAEEIVFVPWCTRLAGTLQLLRDRFCSVAVVVNEFGESLGIVTYRDILDTILLPHTSRGRKLLRRDPVLQVAPGCYHVDGITTLRYLARRLGVDYEPTDDGILTVAGVLCDQLEHVPVVNDECTWCGFHMKVIEASRRGHVRVKIVKTGGP